MEIWTNALGVSEHTLRNAIAAVGPGDAVREHLGNKSVITRE